MWVNRNSRKSSKYLGQNPQFGFLWYSQWISILLHILWHSNVWPPCFAFPISQLYQLQWIHYMAVPTAFCFCVLLTLSSPQVALGKSDTSSREAPCFGFYGSSLTGLLPKSVCAFLCEKGSVGFIRSLKGSVIPQKSVSLGKREKKIYWTSYRGMWFLQQYSSTTLYSL